MSHWSEFAITWFYYIYIHQNNAAYQFVGVLGPSQVADLRSGVDTLQWLTGECVPEPDTSVCCTTPAGQKAVLVGRPRDGFHRGNVICVRLYWIDAVHVPHEQFVVVATGGKMLVVRGPLQTTNLKITILYI